MAVQMTASASNKPQAWGVNVVAALSVIRPSISRLIAVPVSSATASIFTALARATIGLPSTEPAASHRNEETKIRLGTRPVH